MNKCPKCGKEFKLSRKDKSLRTIVSLQARLFPALKEISKKTKDYCNECWKVENDSSAQGILRGMTKDYKWTCPICKKQFEKDTTQGLGMAKENHMRTHRRKSK